MTIETWSETRGEKPFRVWVGERPDKGLTVWLRWYVEGKPKYQLTAVRKIRDERGRVRKRDQEKAQKEADEKIDELRGTGRARRPAGPLTLREGVRMAFSDRGPYPLDPKADKHTRETTARAEEAIELLGGDPVLWEEITPGMVRAIWRQVAKQYPGGGGYNKAEKIVIAFYRIASWLQGEFPDQRFPAPLKGWRKQLREHWAKQGNPIVTHQPRHAEEEISRLWEGRKQADPRLRLALVVGGRLRGGQVIRTMRSHYDPDGGIPMRRGGLGRLEIPYVSERKRAPKLSLNWRERLELERALRRGHLSELEAAYRAREIDDFPLFPGGKLRGGKAPVREQLVSLHPDSIAELFHKYERTVGVDPEKGRAWHGLRRGFSDLDETSTPDARVKDRLGGWAPGSEMRRKIYQVKESDAIDEAAAHARAQVRPSQRKDG